MRREGAAVGVAQVSREGGKGGDEQENILETYTWGGDTKVIYF
jgi:hypothetical protein